MKNVINWIKVVKINLLITLVLLLIIEITLSVAFFVRDNFVKNKEIENINVTAETVGFRNETKNFRGYPYKAFLGWVSPDIQGEFLNVIKERRITLNPEDLVSNDILYFFGGSTMWGHSVSDKNTIPSLVSQQLKIKAINYSEQAYNSRQELNLLLNNIDRIEKGHTVIFYDGVNDVYHNCRSYNSPNGHAREYYIRDALTGSYGSNNSIFTYLDFLSTYRFIHGLSKKLNLTHKIFQEYTNSCDDPVYASNVADFLVNNWEGVEAILAAKGVNFLCILQPNPYTFDGSINYSNKEMKSQIDLVYPLIRRKAKDLSCFQDYSSILRENNYVDSCCHLNELGNVEVSAQLRKDLSRKLRLK
ncbi:hypothetical protein N9713_01870 [Candidatus Pelagibacter sp.]|nr:hypothetical protein [Candidatus Pelagibacter sp.]MDC0452202.1 hypothetical protein [Candidatus Pelagibacter sp.]